MTEQTEPGRRNTPVIAQLAEIRLKNFKSVTDATVELRLLSVVVGRNSSGKSTLLQSVLALAQAIRNNSETSQFPLNGKLVRLGTFAELLSFQATSQTSEIQLGFTVASKLRPRLRPDPTSPEGEALTLISWTGHLSSPGEQLSGFATLSAFEVYTTIKHGDTESGLVSLDVSSVRPDATENPLQNRRGPRGYWSETLVLDVEGRIFDYKSGNSARVDTVALSGGLPIAAFHKETQIGYWARMFWEEYNNNLQAEVKKHKVRLGEEQADGKEVKKWPDAIIMASKHLHQILELRTDLVQNVINDGPPGPDPVKDDISSHIFQKCRELSSGNRNHLARSLASLDQAEFNTRFKKKMADTKFLDYPVRVPIDKTGMDLWGAIEVADYAFQNLQYLGPLRESPQVLYNPSPSQIDLGIKGEHTAAVLHAQRNNKVLVPLPGGSSRIVTVGEALNAWLVELGLADGAQATDQGRMGFGLTVSPAGSGKDVDLTSVGVGVSQVLPVLLLCLLAREGSVVLLEQPELHLHPEMQLRLADFLLACARSGRQIIVETHSEHLVNRLRLHVAQDETNATRDVVQLLFAEQENGVTSYSASQINPLGGLSEDWPRGFLDVGADEAGQLMRQTVLRHRQLSAKKD